MKPRDIPNLITVFRFLLVPPLVWLLLDDRFAAALVVFGVAGFSDALDGYLAKQFQWTSRLGSLLDPLADKLLLIAAFVTLGWLHVIPLWLVGLVCLRDLVIVAGAVSYHFLIEPLTAEPSLISKLNTLAQILLVLAVMINRDLYALPPLWLDVLIYSVLASTLWSGFDYVWTWSRKALRTHDGA
ncbi:MAG: CDP-alcohol phosphatidyltransferase family protein [Gammaproteobacteria bacterium]